MIPLQLPCNILIVAPTSMGKTYLLNNTILPQIKSQYDILVIFSPTMELSGDFNHITDNNKTIFKITTGLKGALEELIDSQTSMFKSVQLGIIDKSQIPRICVVLDDCITDKSLFNFKGILDGFATKNRHYQISFIVLSQRLSAIPRTMRLNSKYIIMFSSWNVGETEQFLRQYVSKSKQKNFLKQVEEVFKQKYTYILFDNSQHDINKRILINGSEVLKIN